MEQEEHVSPDGTLRLVVVRDDEGDGTLGFAGFRWHTHGDALAASYPFDNSSGLTPESAARRFVQDVMGTSGRPSLRSDLTADFPARQSPVRSSRTASSRSVPTLSFALGEHQFVMLAIL